MKQAFSIVVLCFMVLSGCSSNIPSSVSPFDYALENNDLQSERESTSDTNTLEDPSSSQNGGDQPHETMSQSTPHWVLSTPEHSDPNIISIITSATVQDFGGIEAQRRSALLRAKSEVSKIIRTHIEAVEELKTVSSKNYNDHSYESSVREKSQNWLSFENLEIIEQWIDPASGELFLWLQLDGSPSQ